MAERVIEKHVDEKPRDTVVIDDRDSKGNNGLMVAIVVLVIILLLILFGRGLIGGGGRGTNVNVTPSSGGSNSTH